MGELFEIFVDNIAPILIVAALGYVIGRRFQVDPRPVGRMIFYIFSPALVFDSLSRNHVSPAELGQIAVLMTLFVFIMAGLAYAATRLRAETRLDRAGMMLMAVCPNNGNFGLPLIGFAFDPDVLARAVVCYVAVTILNYSVGIFIASSGHRGPREALWNISRAPVAYAALAGLLVNATQLDLPPVLARSAALMAGASVPCMLVLLGLQLARMSRLSHARLVGMGTGLRLFASPLVALALVTLLGIQGPAGVAFLMQASMPVAVVTIIFATEFGLDVSLVSSTILATTVVSPVTLSILILLLRRTLVPG